MLENQEIEESKLIICTRCIYDERVDAIEFDEDGVCSVYQKKYYEMKKVEPYVPLDN